MRTFIIATRNVHKVQEIRSLLGSGFSYMSLIDFPGAPQTLEDAATFAGNASKKAVDLSTWLSVQPGWDAEKSREVLVLADDSGLEVDALGGAPGVHSARFAALGTQEAGNSSDAENNTKLLRLLDGVPSEKRTARFRCCIAIVPVIACAAESASPVCMADETELSVRVYDGACEGRIGFAPQGNGGFGYDPLFIPEGYEFSFAELGEGSKNTISHRARALLAVRQALGT